MARVLKDWYLHQGAAGDTMVEVLHSLPHFARTKMPVAMDHRYISEEIPYGLIPCVEFMDQLGFDHRAHTALADVLCAVCGKDFYREARTMKECGLSGMDGDRVMEFLAAGR